jgi:hypothetical protein
MAEPVGIIASVGDQLLGLGQGVEHQCCTFVVARRTLGQEHDDRSSRTIR